MMVMDRHAGRRVLFLALLLLLSCSKENPSPAPPNLVLISIDDLAADHLGCYGYARDTSPFLDRLAREGVLFHECIAQETWTLPSHASMLSSRYVSAHTAWGIESRLPGKHLPLLQEVLRAGGYTTAAFTTCLYLSRTYGFERGFDHFESKRCPAPELNARILDYLGSRDRGPFFLFIHYYDVHSPFIEKNPYGDGFKGERSKEYTALVKKLKGFRGRKVADLAPEELDWIREHLAWENLKGLLDTEEGRRAVISDALVETWALEWLRAAGPAAMGSMKAAYDNGIAFMDKHLSDLFDGLRRLPGFENTIFMITSDHGEAFNEHAGVVGHGDLPYRELVHVPLICWGRGIPRGGRVRVPVASIDIAPTLLAWAGRAAPGGFQGRSLLPLLRTGRAGRRAILSGSMAARRLALREARWKVLVDMKKGKTFLFDLLSPGGEGEDLSGVDPGRAERLRELLFKAEQHNREMGAALSREEAVLDEAARARLRELGYIK